MRTGRPATPLEQKQRTGTVRPSRIRSIAPIPAADRVVIEGIGPLGRALLDAGAAVWLGKTDQLLLLRLIEDAWDERIELRARWRGSNYSNETVMKRLGRVEEDLTKWLSQAGLTPSDRARLGVAAVKARTKLEELAEKRRRLGA